MAAPRIGQVDVEPVSGHWHICAGRAPKTHERIGVQDLGPRGWRGSGSGADVVVCHIICLACTDIACPQPCKRTSPKEPYERRRIPPLVWER
jgi:hypothetical protein